MALSMSRAGPRNPPAPRRSAEEQVRDAAKARRGAGSEQPCPRHRSAGQEAGEGAADPAAGPPPQTRTGNKAGGEAALPRELRRRPAQGEGSDGRKDARGAPRHRGEPYCRERTLPRRFILGGQPEYTHTLTLTPSAPREPCPRLQGVWEGSDPTPPPPHTHPPTPRRLLPSADPAASARLGGPTAGESQLRRPDPFPAGRATLPPSLTSSQTLTGLGGGNEGNLPRPVPSRPMAASPAVTRTHLSPPPRPGAAGGEGGRRLYRPLKWLREPGGGERGGGASPRSAGSAVQSSRRRLADAPPRRKGRGRARSEAAAGGGER
ncbi:basic salivary proline-rich protein 3-like [Haliaeetus albicilla]|uniref:basic salivary proline-rich protein 3-like n=1 Tax=Haliaeetus albicilla TaxID=8969 RepID=UPI0037E6FF9B